MSDFNEKAESKQQPIKPIVQLHLFDTSPEIYYPKSYNKYTEQAYKIHHSILKMMEQLSDNDKDILTYRPKTGRPGLSLYNVLCIRIFMSQFPKFSLKDAVRTIQNDYLLRRVMGIGDNIELCYHSVCKLSLKLIDFINMQAVSKSFIAKAIKLNQIKGSEIVSVDSTIFQVHEKAENEKSYYEYLEEKRQEEEEEAANPKRRGRYKKDSPEEIECHRRQEEEAAKERLQEYIEYNAPISCLLKLLNHGCGWTCKQNSQGHKAWMRGYKGHFLATSKGVILAHEFTSASESDFNVIIPLLRQNPLKTHLVLADRGYSSDKVRNFIDHFGAHCIIDRKKDKNSEELSDEYKMTEFEKELYKVRSSIEQANGHLKQTFIEKDWRFRGKNLIFQFELSVFLYNVKRIEETA